MAANKRDWAVVVVVVIVVDIHSTPTELPPKHSTSTRENKSTYQRQMPQQSRQQR
jgi:hypothetical protein